MAHHEYTHEYDYDYFELFDYFPEEIQPTDVILHWEQERKKMRKKDTDK